MERKGSAVGGHTLTLHEESAQQLIGGHGFDLCSQVDVSAHHQRRPPESEDPEDRTARKHPRIRAPTYAGEPTVTHAHLSR